ncbi:MAG: hypothetical protein ABIN58_00990 [candidate division WOR-3 bacterium]
MQKEVLARALKLVAPALHTRDFIPVLTHVCFDDDKIFAFDDKTAVLVYENTGIRGAVRGRVLIEAVENADDELKLEKRGTELALVDSTSTLCLPMLSPETFLFQMPDLDAIDVSITADKNTVGNFLSCLELAASTSNEESLRPELVGVTIKVEDGEINLYSTDNISCTKIVVHGLEVEGRGEVIIPKSSCQLLAKTFRDLAEDLESCSFYFSKAAVLTTYLVKEKSDVWVVCKTISATPADYEAILEAVLENRDYGDVPEGLEKALSRASVMFKDDYDKLVQISPTDTGIDLYCKGGYGELKVSIESEVSPEDTVAVNPDLVRRMLDRGQAIMFCSSALALISELDGQELIYLVAYKRG